MASLKEYFKMDLTSFLSLQEERKLELRSENPDYFDPFEITIHQKVLIENNSGCRYFAFYIPKHAGAFVTVGFLLDEIELTKEIFSKNQALTGLYYNDIILGNQPQDNFYSNKIYFYLENELDDGNRKSLDSYAKEKGLILIIRDPRYQTARQMRENPKAFISHDSRDKEGIVRPIVEGLQSRLYPIWYDEYSLKPGDGLRESIERGIKDAAKCVLVLSKNFLRNPGWTKKEFDSIFTREMLFDEKIIIPIWVDVSKEEVYEYSPSLPDIIALLWPKESDYQNEDDFNAAREKVISKLHSILP